MDEIIYILLGLAVGFIGGVAGIGGAPFLIALLVLIFGFSQFSAQGTVLTMMLGPMSLLGVLAMKKEAMSQWKNIIIGVVSYGFFSYYGAILAFELGETSLQKYFAAMLIAIAILQFFPNFSAKKETESIPWVWMLAIGSSVGVVGGLFGIGAGVLMIPIFIIFFHLKKNYARALSLAILLPPVSLGAFIKYNEEGTIIWSAVVILFFSYFVANYWGVKVGNKISLPTFKKIYAFLLVLIAGIIFFK